MTHMGPEPGSLITIINMIVNPLNISTAEKHVAYSSYLYNLNQKRNETLHLI